MEWKEVRLGDLYSVHNGLSKAGKYFGYGFPFLTFSDVFKNYFLPTEFGNKVDSSEKEQSIFDIKRGDVFITRTSETADELGMSSVALVDVPYATYNGFTKRLRPINDEDVVLPEFIGYYLRSKSFRHNFFLLSGGMSTRASLANADLLNMSVKLPTISTQRRIANILSSLDHKIELNNKINAQLEEMAQAIFKSWFVDFEPFKNGKFVESELGMIPEGWRVGTLNEVADINPKRTIKKGAEATYLDMKNMPTSGSFPNQWEKKVMNGGMKFKNGDTLMARITPCLENGKVAYVNFLENNEVGFGSTEYIVMTSKSGVLPEILYTLCRYPDFVAYATRNMNGSSGRQRVSGEVIGNYKIVIPPTNVVERVQPLFASTMEQIKVHGFESLHLSHLRDTLLPKLMSGEIEI